jgi:hypothetical protein
VAAGYHNTAAGDFYGVGENLYPDQTRATHRRPLFDHDRLRRSGQAMCHQVRGQGARSGADSRIFPDPNRRIEKPSIGDSAGLPRIQAENITSFAGDTLQHGEQRSGVGLTPVDRFTVLATTPSIPRISAPARPQQPSSIGRGTKQRWTRRSPRSHRAFLRLVRNADAAAAELTAMQRQVG